MGILWWQLANINSSNKKPPEHRQVRGEGLVGYKWMKGHTNPIRSVFWHLVSFLVTFMLYLLFNLSFLSIGHLSQANKSTNTITINWTNSSVMVSYLQTHKNSWQGRLPFHWKVDFIDWFLRIKSFSSGWSFSAQHLYVFSILKQNVVKNSRLLNFSLFIFPKFLGITSSPLQTSFTVILLQFET